MNVQVPPMLADAPLVRDWISVDGEGAIRILSGRVELGQGNATALLQIGADELGISADEIGIVTARTDRTPNEGFTVGSLSITFGGLAVRWAASAMRMLVLAKAAETLGCDAGDLDISDGRVVKGDEDTGLTLLDLAPEVDRAVPVADHAAPRAPGARWSLKREIRRIDLAERLTGAPFIQDVVLPEMLFGAPVHPPHMEAKLVSLDLDALKARSGVVEVVKDGSFVGVIAESHAAALKAADWARASGTWDVDTREVGDPIAQMASDDSAPETVMEKGEVNRNDGRWFESEASRPYLFHGSIGPATGVAVWDGEAVTVWSHSQGVFPLRQAIATTLRMPEERITVIHHPGAGCYGHNGADDAALDAVLLARAVPGKPVKVIWSRIDEFRSAPMGPGMVTKVRALLGPDDRVRAMDVEVNSPPHSGRPMGGGTPNLRAAAYIAEPIPPAPGNDPPLARGGGAERNAVPTYAFDDIKVRKRMIRDLPYRTSALRSLGAFTNVVAVEGAMHDIAADLGEDQFAFRIRHLDDPRAKAVLERLDEETRALREGLDETEGWGIGYAQYKGFGAYGAVFARITLGDDVRVTDLHCVADMGEVINPDGARNQIEGGAIQSVSWTLKEAVTFDGPVVSPEGWLDYPILKFSEVPRVKVTLIDRQDQKPLGAGEVSQAPTAAAVANAVREVLGVRVSRFPISREAIIAAASA